MARQSKGGDPAATKYHSTFQNVVEKNAAVPKAEADDIEVERPKPISRKRKAKRSLKR